MNKRNNQEFLWKFIITVLVTGDFAITLVQGTLRDLISRISMFAEGNLTIIGLVLYSITIWALLVVCSDTSIRYQRMRGFV